MPNSLEKTSAEAGFDPGHDRSGQHASRVNLSQIESAHRVVPVELYSIEAQRAFKRRFDLMQVNLYHVLVRSSPQVPRGLVAEAEGRVRSQLEKSAGILNDAATRAE